MLENSCTMIWHQKFVMIFTKFKMETIDGKKSPWSSHLPLSLAQHHITSSQQVWANAENEA